MSEALQFYTEAEHRRVPRLTADLTIDPEQLAELDQLIAVAVFHGDLPNATRSKGLKYARWAEVDGIAPHSLSRFYDANWCPALIFKGTIFGRPKTIYMWLPVFD